MHLSPIGLPSRKAASKSRSSLSRHVNWRGHLQVRRTKIVCTLGPSSMAPAVLRRLVSAGIDVARLNFSHGDPAFHTHAAEAVKLAADREERHVALLQDLQGPKIRTGELEEPFVQLRRGQTVRLTAAPVRGNGEVIAVSHPELIQALRPRDRVLLAD